MFSVKEEVTQVAIVCRRLASLKVIFPSKVVVLPSLDMDSASSPLSTLLLYEVPPAKLVGQKEEALVGAVGGLLER